MERHPDSSYVLLPEYVGKLLRIGDIDAVVKNAHLLRKKVYGENIYDRILKFLKIRLPVSDRYKWLASNILSLVAASFSELRLKDKYSKDAHSNRYSSIFQLQQYLFDADVQIQLGNFETAKELIEEITNDEHEDLKSPEFLELSFLFFKMNLFEIASEMLEKAKVLDRNNLEYTRHKNFQKNQKNISNRHDANKEKESIDNHSRVQKRVFSTKRKNKVNIKSRGNSRDTGIQKN